MYAEKKMIAAPALRFASQALPRHVLPKLRMHTMFLRVLRCIIATSFAATITLALPVAAADKALLIGVGEYASAENNLPGISLDLKVMQGVALEMGYLEENIRLLRDSEVTSENVREVMSTWLLEDISAEDRVLVYYSGHGSQVPDQNGDERDGFDEVLTMHNLAFSNGEYSGVLRDDEFNQLLSAIPSERIAVVVDACCSGTAVRSHSLTQSAYGQGEFVVKSRRCRSTQTDSAAGFADAESVEGMVFLAAAQDGEQSLATNRGSVFTLALQQAVREGRNGDPFQLIAAAEKTVMSSVPQKFRFHPSLIGDPILLQDKGLFVAEAGQARQLHPAWDDWSSLVKHSAPLQVQPSREYYDQGQLLELEVEMPTAGYLNIVAVNSDDQVVVLFPNEYHHDNQFEAGVINLPKKGFEWPAGRPFGDSLIVSVVSQQRINLFASSHQRDARGEPLGVFLRPETADFERLQALALSPDESVDASALVLTVCAASGC